jgi:oligopeptide transport system substrate-binding protein
MKKIIYSLFIVGIFASCGGEKTNTGELRKVNGGVYYGGVFKMNELEDFRNLYPLNNTEVTSHRIDNQIYEGLVQLSQSDLTILPCLAESWEKNADASQWIFHIRKGVKFHDDACFPDGKGRELTADDFKFCFEKLCTSSPENQHFGDTFKDRVVGADEYFQSTIDKKPLAGGVSGIKIIDDHTLQINLINPFAGFLNILITPGCWIYPHEALEKYGIDMRTKCVGTGPFQVKNIKEGEVALLERNPNYWAVDEYGNQLPYLDAVKFSFIKEKKSELMEFKRGNLDMMFRLPVEMIPDILGELGSAKEGRNPFEMQVVPAMSIFYYGFQHQSTIFNKKEVRLAFNYAIDRDKIVNYTLQGEGVAGSYGIVPPSFKGYDNDKLKGYEFDVDKARKYLATAGYPDGRGFPKLSLQINSGGGDRNIQTAEVIQKMLKENLNIDIEISVMPFAEHLESTETGKAQFWRAGWTADYPDPETFLTLLYSKHIPENPSDRSYLNTTRYRSAKFDSLFSAAMKEVDDKKRFDLYLKADQQAIDDAAIMPIFYNENYRLIQTNVRNFPANAMEYRHLTSVYFIPKDPRAKNE